MKIMKRMAHSPSSLPIQTAPLVARLHNQDQTLRVPAGSGLVISHSLPTANTPGRTTLTLNNQAIPSENEATVTELIDHLDELIDNLDRYHEALTNLLQELDPDRDK